MVAAVGEFTLTGVAATFVKGYNLVAAVGSFVVTAVSATLKTTAIWTKTDKPSAPSYTEVSKPSDPTYTEIDKP